MTGSSTNRTAVRSLQASALEPHAVIQHQLWGLLLLVLIVHGPGRLSLDRLIARRVGFNP